MAEKQSWELDDVDEAVEAVVKAAEGRTAVTSLLNQIKEMVDADAFTCLAQDVRLLGDEQAAQSVVSVVGRAFDRIDGTLDLEDVKYIAKQAKFQRDTLNFSHHGGAYFKISSGETETIRVDLDGNLINSTKEEV